LQVQQAYLPVQQEPHQLPLEQPERQQVLVLASALPQHRASHHSCPNYRHL
jgi:hypothetical protein